MSKKGRSSVVLLGSLVVCLLLMPLVYLAFGTKLDRIALNKRIALLESATVTSPAALQSRYRAAREHLLQILPPDPDYKLNPSGGLVVFDPANFSWAEALEPAELNGVTVYPVIVAEDPETRYTAFYNGSAELIGYLAPEQDYFPFTWLADRHPEYYAENADPDALAWAEAIYDPSRVSVTYYLLPADNVEAMAEAQLAAVQQPEFQMNMMMGEGLPEPVTNLVIFAIEKATNGIALGIGWPDDFTNKLEVFARSTIATTGWFVVSTNLSTAGTNSLWWTDTSLTTSDVTRFYSVGNADLDSDGDGVVDARERKVTGTDENAVDTDGDGLIDGYSGKVTTNSYPGGARTNGGVYVEGEMTWGTELLLTDTDGDGMGDGWEVANGHDPLDPNDPPSVSGTVIYNGYQWWGPIRVVAVTSSNSWSTDHCIVLGYPGSYRIPNLSATNYWIKAWMDSDESETVNHPEAEGFLLGSPIWVTNRLTGQDITLTDQDYDADGLPDWWEIYRIGNITNWNGSADPDADQYTNLEEYDADTDPLNSLSHPWNISGTISYSGPQTGLIYVVASTSATEWAAVQYVALATPGAYVITHLPPDKDYWIRAWRDTYTNGTPDFGEAWGDSQDNPVSLTENVAAVDVTLVDDDSDGDSLPDWWEVLYGFDPYIGGGGNASAWWKLDAATGTNVQDSTSHTNHGVLLNAGTNAWTSGVISNALSFDGVDDFVQIPDSASLKPDIVSVSLWVKPAHDYTNGTATFLSKKQSGGSTGFRLSYEQGALSFLVCASGEKVVSLPCNLASGVWHHVVGTYGGPHQRLYVDGVLVAQTNYNWGTAFGFIDQGTTSARIGASAGSTASNHFAGVIDDVRIYGGELVSNQVWGLYEPGSDEDGDGLSAWQEYITGLCPTNGDIDGDGLTDGEEINIGTNPNEKDTDSDNLSDFDEVNLHGTDPLNSDTDGDGLWDRAEIFGEEAWSITTVTSNSVWASPGTNAQWITQWSTGVVQNGRITGGLSGPVSASFRMGSNVFDSIRISSEGFILLGSGVLQDAMSWGVNLPVTRLGVSNLVAVCWDEYSLSAATGLWYEVDGTGLAERVTVTWSGAKTLYAGEQVEGLDFQMQYTASNGAYAFLYRESSGFVFPTHALVTVGLCGTVPAHAARYAFNRLGNLAPGMTVTITPARSDPLCPYSDADDYSDGEEADRGWNPLVAENIGSDADGDGLVFSDEISLGTDPLEMDSDGDSIADGEEVAFGLNPAVYDFLEDNDGDGLDNHLEWVFGTDPSDPDTDNDGAYDSVEVWQGSDPCDSSDGGQAPESVIYFKPGIGYSSSLGLDGTVMAVDGYRLDAYLCILLEWWDMSLPLRAGADHVVSVYSKQGVVQFPSVETAANINGLPGEAVPANDLRVYGNVVAHHPALALGELGIVRPEEEADRKGFFLQNQQSMSPTGSVSTSNTTLRIYSINVTPDQKNWCWGSSVQLVASIDPAITLNTGSPWSWTQENASNFTYNTSTSSFTLHTDATVTPKYSFGTGAAPYSTNIDLHVHHNSVTFELQPFIGVNDNDSDNNGTNDCSQAFPTNSDPELVTATVTYHKACQCVFTDDLLATVTCDSGGDKIRTWASTGMVSWLPDRASLGSGSSITFRVEGITNSDALNDVTFTAKVEYRDHSGVYSTIGAATTILKVESVAVHSSDTNTYKIASVLTNGIDHFVCVKDTGDISLDAVITPTNAANAITWEADGATITSPVVGGDKTTAKLPSATSQKIPVRIKVGSYTCWSGTVWIVWSSVTLNNTVAINVHQVQVTPPSRIVGSGHSGTASWEFEATIQPGGIVTDADHPNLSGTPVSNAPNHNAPHANDGQPFGQPSRKWDISRQWRARILSPVLGTNDMWDLKGLMGGTLYDNLPNASIIQSTTPSPGADSYPQNPVEGNDDSGSAVEDTDPYSAPNVGKLTDLDSPDQAFVLDRSGATNTTIEVRLQFREFVRVELDGHWYVASDYSLWRLHTLMRKVWTPADDANTNGIPDNLSGPGGGTEGHYQDDGSVSDTTNNEW